MKILFIFPPKNSWALNNIKIHKKIDEESGKYPPLGLLYVASYLQKHSNHSVEIIDSPTQSYDYPKLEAEIKNRKPDIVGIYFCTEYLRDAFRTAQVVKRVDAKTIVVAGGPHIFIYPKETIASPHVDYCVYGEGEIAFKNLVEALNSSLDPEKTPGVISKKNIGIEHALQKIDDLNALPFPNRKLLDHRMYKSFITYSNPITTMMTSRGCAFNCHYCNNIERAQRVRFRSADNIVAEIEKIVELGVRDILFFDENFTFDIKRVDEICDAIISKKIKIRWHCRSRADMKLDKTILKKMKNAGCRMIQFGIETGTQRLQKVINKNLDLENVKQTINLVKDEGILTYGNFIIGLPTETKEEMLATVDYSIKLGLDYAPFSVFNPLPDSFFYQEALDNGIIKRDYWHDYVKNPNEPMTDYWWPLHSKEELSRQNYYAFRKFYFRPSYMLRTIFVKQALSQKIWQLKSALKIFSI